MRRILAAACCILWLSYGSLSGLAHTHATSSVDQIHGLGLDHAHDSLDQEPTAHDPIHGSNLDRAASGSHHDGPFYLTANAVRTGAKTVTVPINLAGKAHIPPPFPSVAGHLDNNRQPRDPPSKEPPGLRAPPA